MSQPSRRDIDALNAIADDIAGTLEARGYRVDQAVEADPDFARDTRNAAIRDMVKAAASRAASRSGYVDFRPVGGGGREMRSMDKGTDRRYRLRRAARNFDGEIVVRASSDSILTVVDDDASLFPVERWVFGYVVGDLNTILEVFIAPIVGFEEGSPGRLVLGHEINLLSSPTLPPGGFRSTTEGLDFPDEDDATDAGAA